MSLFKKAKDGAPVSGKSKGAKTEVIINDPNFHKNLTRLAVVNSEIDELEAESKVLTGIAKERAVAEFADLYKKTGKYPGSFNIVSRVPGSNDAQFMFLPTDRYIKIDAERSEELKKKYGEDIVTEKTVYTMDTELVEKYGDIISKLIENCEQIPDSDKAKLIAATTLFEIKKGTITDLLNSTHKAFGEVGEMVEEIKPVFQLKNIKVNV